MLQKSIEKPYIKFIRLNPIDSVKNFDCGDKDLNDFILNQSAAFQKHKIAVNYACVDVEDASKVVPSKRTALR